MQSNDEITTPVSPEEITINVAIELSGKSWVIGVKPPGSGKVGKIATNRVRDQEIAVLALQLVQASLGTSPTAASRT